MNQPQQRGRKREPASLFANWRWARGKAEGTPQQPLQDAGVEHVQQHVEHVIAPGLGSTDGIIDRKGQIQERPTVGRNTAARLWQQDFRQVGQIANGAVFGDRSKIVEEKRDVKTIRIDGQRDQQIDRRNNEEPTVAGRFGGFAKGSRTLGAALG